MTGLTDRPEGMSAGEWYAGEVDRIMDRDGTSVTKAAATVAEANGVSTGNVIAQRGAWRRAQGIGTPAHPRVRPAHRRADKIVDDALPPDWTPPRELATMLDELGKATAMTAVAEAKQRARDAALRAIREATDKL